MPGLRLLLRLLPPLAALVATLVWLRHRRRRLAAPPEPLLLEAAPVASSLFEPARPEPEPVAVELERVAAGPVAAADLRAASEPVDIVTIVDDLLEIGR